MVICDKYYWVFGSHLLKLIRIPVEGTQWPQVLFPTNYQDMPKYEGLTIQVFAVSQKSLIATEKVLVGRHDGFHPCLQHCQI